VGDEALLLARAAPTWVARDRVAAGRAAIAAGADILVMDDGFQNPRLAYDLALLVIDGGYGFGNGRVMPAGPLREPVTEGLGRADAVVLMGDDSLGTGALLGTRKPVLRARLAPAVGADRLAGRRVVAFAGIGRPKKFFATLRSLGAEVVEARAFSDHHPYRPTEIEAILAHAEAADAVPVTTEKDAVRLPAAARARIDVLAVTVAWDDPAGPEALLDRIAAKEPAAVGAVKSGL
jgi:tetraacyldisaccharide 4'-kinase